MGTFNLFCWLILCVFFSPSQAQALPRKIASLLRCLTQVWKIRQTRNLCLSAITQPSHACVCRWAVSRLLCSRAKLRLPRLYILFNWMYGWIVLACTTAILFELAMAVQMCVQRSSSSCHHYREILEYMYHIYIYIYTYKRIQQQRIICARLHLHFTRKWQWERRWVGGR